MGLAGFSADKCSCLVSQTEQHAQFGLLSAGHDEFFGGTSGTVDVEGAVLAGGDVPIEGAVLIGGEERQGEVIGRDSCRVIAISLLAGLRGNIAELLT